MTLVARLKVTLSDVEPQVLRRFDVPLKIKLNRLHEVIQAAMGWTDSHLYEFRAGGVGWGSVCVLARRFGADLSAIRREHLRRSHPPTPRPHHKERPPA